jgi:hypothetical protein
MNARMKVLLGVSAFALLSGAAPLVPAMLVPAADNFGLAVSPLAANAEAQESGEGEGEGTTECAPPEGEEGEGEEGGSADCVPPEGEGGEDGEGEG